MREITMEMTTMLVQVRHDRHPRLQRRRNGELGPGHLQGVFNPRGPHQLLPVQQAVGNDNDQPSGLSNILSYHGISPMVLNVISKNIILIVLYFNDAGGECGVSRDCAPVVREPCHLGVVDTSLA